MVAIQATSVTGQIHCNRCDAKLQQFTQSWLNVCQLLHCQYFYQHHLQFIYRIECDGDWLSPQEQEMLILHMSAETVGSVSQ